MAAIDSSLYLASIYQTCGEDGTSDNMLLDTVERFLRNSHCISRARATRGDLPAVRKHTIWPKLEQLGLLRACVPTRCDGYEMSLATAVFISELCGRYLTLEPLIPCSFFPVAYLSEVQNSLTDALLRKMASGTALPTMALQEKSSEPYPEVCETQLAVDGNCIRISGSKSYINSAPLATHFVVLASMGGTPGVVIVPSHIEGVDVRPYEMADGTFWGDVYFDSVTLPKDALIDTGSDCVQRLHKGINWATLVTCGELFGLQTSLFNVTLEYLKTRTQFGRPIGTYQALQHRMVDLYTIKELTRYVIGDALQQIRSTDFSTRTVATISRCKARTADSAMRIAREAVQMHGAMGYSDECDVGLYLKRTIVLSAWLGGADFHRRRYATLNPLELC